MNENEEKLLHMYAIFVWLATLAIRPRGDCSAPLCDGHVLGQELVVGLPFGWSLGLVRLGLSQ